MNNDRFKFRVWDVLAEKYSTEVGYWVSDDGNLHLRDLLCEPGFWIPEQCTGLKDKNGKLIYEGDIVVVPNQYPFYDYAEGVKHKDFNSTCGEIKHDAELNYIGIIEWEEETANFVMVLQCVNPRKRGISSGIAEQLDEYETLEVIGNIHETEVKNA